MSEDLLDALKQEFDQGKYQIENQKIKIGRMDAASEEVQKLASDLGLRIDQGKDMREPQVVFYYKGEFFHWNHGWLRHHKVKVLHWINNISKNFTLR